MYKIKESSESAFAIRMMIASNLLLRLKNKVFAQLLAGALEDSQKKMGMDRRLNNASFNPNHNCSI
jgi:hypothetical protein